MQLQAYLAALALAIMPVSAVAIASPQDGDPPGVPSATQILYTNHNCSGESEFEPTFAAPGDCFPLLPEEIGEILSASLIFNQFPNCEVNYYTDNACEGIPILAVEGSCTRDVRRFPLRSTQIVCPAEEQE